MRRMGVLVVAGLSAAALGDPVSIDFFHVGGEWGVFADDGVGGLNIPDQGVFDLSPGPIFESWTQVDGIAAGESSISGELVVESNSEGAVFAGELDLRVSASVDGDGPGDNELAIANLGLTSVMLGTQLSDSIILTVDRRPVVEVLQGLGVLGIGEHELAPGEYWFEAAGSGLFLDATAAADQTVTDSGEFGWSMRFSTVPSAPALAVFAVAGVTCAGRRRR